MCWLKDWKLSRALNVTKNLDSKSLFHTRTKKNWNAQVNPQRNDMANLTGGILSTIWRRQRGKWICTFNIERSDPKENRTWKQRSRIWNNHCSNCACWKVKQAATKVWYRFACLRREWRHSLLYGQWWVKSRVDLHEPERQRFWLTYKAQILETVRNCLSWWSLWAGKQGGSSEEKEIDRKCVTR